MTPVEGVEDLRRRFAPLINGDASERLLGNFGDLVIQYAVGNASRFRKTGNLARSIRIIDLDKVNQSVSVGAGGTRLVQNATTGGMINSGYAAHVEFGTKPHDIKPRRKRALFFPSQYALNANRQRVSTRGFIPSGSVKTRLSGNATAATNKRFGTMAYQYARIVHHPGTRPQPYLIPAAKDALRDVGLSRHIVDAWNRAA